MGRTRFSFAGRHQKEPEARGVGVSYFRKAVRKRAEAAVVPARVLWRGGCWVILSFTHALVRVSRSGGTVSMSDKQHTENT